MNSPTWNIIKKDFRRCWVLLALWWAILGLRAVNPAMEMAANLRVHYVTDGQGNLHVVTPANPFKNPDFVNALMVFLAIADVLVLLTITSTVIAADSPINDRAYYRTLPISGRQILTAKAMFFALFCGVVPAVFSIATKIGYGFPPSAWLDGLFWYLIGLACWVIGATVATTLFKRPLIAAIVFFVAYVIGWAVFDEICTQYFPNVSMGQSSNGQTVCAFILLITGLIITTYMYLRRLRVWGFGFLAFGLLVSHLALFFWSPLWPFPPWNWRSSTVAHADQPGLVVKEFETRPATPVNDSDSITGYLSGPIVTAYPNEAWLLSDYDAKISWPGHLENHGLAASNNANTLTVKPANYADVLQALGLGKMPLNLEPSLRSVMTLAWVHKELETQFAQAPAHWLGEIGFEVGPLTRGGEVPFAEGAYVQNGWTGLGINTIQHTQDTVRMDIICFAVQPSGRPFTPESMGGTWTMYSSLGYFFVLWNPKLQEVIPADYYVEDHDQNGESKIPEGNGLLLVTMHGRPTFHFNSLDPTSAAPKRSDAEIDAWLTDARLVELRFSPENYYKVSATIDPFVLPPVEKSESP